MVLDQAQRYQASVLPTPKGSTELAAYRLFQPFAFTKPPRRRRKARAAAEPGEVRILHPHVKVGWPEHAWELALQSR